MSDKKPGTNPLLARYKSTVDKFYKDVPDTDNEIPGDGITLKRKRQNSKEDSENLEKKCRLEDVDGVNVSRESSVDGLNVSRESSVDGSRVSSTDINWSVSRQCHDGKEGNLKNEENKLTLVNKRHSFDSDDKKTFFEDKDCGLRKVSQENGVDRNTIRTVNFKKTDEEPEQKREKLIKTGDVAGSIDEGENSKSVSKKGSFDESSCVSAEHKTSSIMKVSYNEKEGKLEMVLEGLTSVSKKRDSVCPPDKKDGLKIVYQEGGFLNENIMTDKTEKEADKLTSARKKESALKQKENYSKITKAFEKLIERNTASKKTYICKVCRVSFSSAEIKHHQQLCPSVVVKRLTVPELTSWLSFSPLKTKVVLERLKENDIKFWSSKKVHGDGLSSLGQRCKKDSMLRPISSRQAKLLDNSLEQAKDKEQENVCAADNKYVCGKCKMTFPDVSNLKLHLLNHLTEPEKLKMSSETVKKDEPLAKSTLFKPKPQENSSDPKSPMIATSLLSRGSLTKIYSPGLQSKTISSAPPILMNSPNPNNCESSPETNKNPVKVKPKKKSSGFEPLIIFLKNKTSVKQTSDSLTLPASVTLCMDTQKTPKLNLQTNAAIQENNVKLPAEVGNNNAWSTRETVAFPRIKQEVDDLLGTCSQSVNLKPTWMSYNLQNLDSPRSINTSLTRGTYQVVDHDSSRSVNTSLTRGTHQVVDHDSSRSINTSLTRGTHQLVDHDSSRSINTSLTRGTHQVVDHDSSRSINTSLTRGTHQVVDHDRQFTNHFTIQGGSIQNSMASSDIYCLAKHYLDSSGEGSMSNTTGTGSASVVGSPIPNRSALKTAETGSALIVGSPIPNRSALKTTETGSALIVGSPIPNRSALKTTESGSASVVGSPIPNRSALIVSTSLFSHGKANSSASKSSLTIQNSVTALPSPSSSAKTLQVLRDKLKNSQVIVNQMHEKKTIPGQTSLSKMSQISQQESARKSQMPSSDFSCSICSTILRTAEELRKHEIVHTLSSKLKAIVSRVKKADEFVCAQCKMSFDKEEELKIHMAVHRSQKNPVIKSQVQAEEFVCGVCKQIFHTDNDLKTHITSVHKIKIEDSEENEVFYCGLCNKSFRTSSDLENHMPVHTMDKFVCGICSQPFVQSKQLIEHMGSHAGTSAL
ncbi:hypothetical protein ACJMK2_026834 [Sinanodonta woodiana]|uniref:C2H2-type domain-containing protein n=1 Tax=Sinanodonta woodiana TaxID=1069815 RepID=A0ABD3XPG9_SINWO